MKECTALPSGTLIFMRAEGSNNKTFTFAFRQVNETINHQGRNREDGRKERKIWRIKVSGSGGQTTEQKK